MLDEHVELLERAFVHQEFEPLSGGELAPLVLRFDARLAAPGACPGATFFELLEDVLHGCASPLRRKIHSMYGHLRVNFPPCKRIGGEQKTCLKDSATRRCLIAALRCFSPRRQPWRRQPRNFRRRRKISPQRRARRAPPRGALASTATGAVNSLRSAAKRLTSSSSRSMPRERRRSTPVSIAPGSLPASARRNPTRSTWRSSPRAKSTRAAAAPTAPSP